MVMSLTKVGGARSSFPAAQFIIARNPKLIGRAFLQANRQPEGNSALRSIALDVLILDATQRPHSVRCLVPNQPNRIVGAFHHGLDSPGYLGIVSQLPVLQASHAKACSNPKAAIASR